MYEHLFFNAQIASVDTDTPVNTKLLNASTDLFVVAIELFY